MRYLTIFPNVLGCLNDINNHNNDNNMKYKMSWFDLFTDFDFIHSIDFETKIKSYFKSSRLPIGGQHAIFDLLAS